MPTYRAFAPLIRLLPVLALMACAGLAAAATNDDKDEALLKSGTPARLWCYVETETSEGIVYKTLKNQAAAGQKKKWSEVRSVIYLEMKDGHWPKAEDARDRGEYELAADRFNAVATTGSREWQKVYGSYYEGDALELAGKFDAAAEAFGRVVGGYPAHRLWLDAKYRQGFCLARAKKADAATKIADELAKLASGEPRLPAADFRANGIRAAAAFADGKPDKVVEFAKKSIFRPNDEPEIWFHFGVFYAEALRQAKRPKDAAIECQRLLSALDADPAKKVQISLILGLCLIDNNDKPGALLELLRLDVLPYGSPDQKCVARYNAGKLLWDEVKVDRGNADLAKDERAAAFLKERERSARLLLTAATTAPGVTSSTKPLAQALLDEMGPDPDAPKPDPKAEAAAAVAKPGDKPADKPKPKPK